jgi:hypothetical protein
VLTSIKRNTQIWKAADGEISTRLVLTDTRRPAEQVTLAKIARSSFTMQGPKGATRQPAAVLHQVAQTKGTHILETGAASMRPFIDAGYTPIPGFQLRYLYFLDPTAQARLTVPILPYDEIARVGAGMYKGQPRAASIAVDALPDQGREGGSIPTAALQLVKQ